MTGSKRKVSDRDEDWKEVGQEVKRKVRRKVWTETDKETDKTTDKSDLEKETSGRNLMLRNGWSTDTRSGKNTKKERT